MLDVGISYAQLNYEGFCKRTENRCSILPGVFHVSLFTTTKNLLRGILEKDMEAGRISNRLG
jgi:hypothetical protein